MRIDRLELTRYGHFTDHSLDFGPRPDMADFHILFGPNEAGKSTLRDAFLHFLYGIPLHTPYNFRHDNKVLEIGATLSFDGQPHSLRRIKKRHNDLLASDGTAASPALLENALGTIGLDNYKTMFSLDDDTLEEGGETILKSEGDLGQLLFSASSGLSDLGQQIEAIRLETSSFFKPGGRSHELATLKKKLAELNQQIKQSDMNAAAFEQLVETEKNSKKQYLENKSRQDLISREITSLQALLQSLPLWHQHQQIGEQLQSLNGEPDLPDGWLAEARELARDHARRDTSCKHALSDLDKGQKHHASIHIDEHILELAPAIEALEKSGLEARFRTSIDIAPRQSELDEIGKLINPLLEQLGQASCKDPSALVLPAAQVELLGELIDERSGVDISSERAGMELERTSKELSEAKEALTHLEQLPALSDFSEYFAALSAGHDDHELGQRQSAVQELQLGVDASLQKMAPWQGTAQDLRQLVPPSQSEIDELRGQQQTLGEQIREQQNRLEEIELVLAERRAEMQTLNQDRELIDDETASAKRGQRDQSWSDHRALLQTPDELNKQEIQLSADNFEAAMAKDDQIREARFHHTSELATLRKLQRDQGKSEAILLAGQRRLEKLQAKEKELAQKAAVLMQSTGLPATMPVAELPNWLDRRQLALEKIEQTDVARQHFENARKNAQINHERLLVAMRDAAIKLPTSGDENADWTRLSTTARLAIEDWKARKLVHEETRKKVENGKQALSLRKEEAKQALESRKSWQGRWQEAMSSCWLAGLGETEPQQVRRTLSIAGELGTHIARSKDLEQRIRDMQADRASYIKEVERLAHLLPEDGKDSEGENLDESNEQGDPLQQAARLRARLANAQQGRDDLKEADTQLQQLQQAAQEARQKLDIINSRFAQMTQQFAATDFGELLLKMERAQEKKNLTQKAAELQSRIIDLLGCNSLDKAREILVGTARSDEELAELKARLASHQGSIRDLDEHVRDLHHEWKTAQKQLTAIGGDALVARMQEEKQTLQLEIEAGTQRFLELSAGVMLVERALQKYRESHRSSLMVQASRAFAAITCGAFSGLQSLPRDEREILVGLRADGTSITADKMSKGTRFQLYLSLRIAGHAEYAARRAPLPFFADDILETFDDERAGNTLVLLQEMSKRGQVIYLTHHQHICDLAIKTCGSSVKIHQLSNQTVPVQQRQSA